MTCACHQLAGSPVPAMVADVRESLEDIMADGQTSKIARFRCLGVK